LSDGQGQEPQGENDLGKVVTVRAFGARLMGGEQAECLAAAVLRAQNHLWNKLVEIEHTARATYRESLLQSDAELSKLTKEAEGKELVIQTLIDARNAERAKTKTKKTENAERFSAQIKAESAALKGLRGRMKELRARAKAAAKPLIEAAELRRREQVKQAAAQAELWWCHKESVLTRFDVARRKAMKEGRELRFHRYDGNGALSVRFTGEGADMRRVMAGYTSMLTFRDPTPEELGRMTLVKGDGGRRQIIEVRAGEKGEDKTIPVLRFLVTLHSGREFPSDAPLKTVTLSRAMHVHKAEWKIVFTFSRQATANEPMPALAPKAAGVDLGFRLVRTDAGVQALRVGTINVGEQVRYVTLGHDWLRRMERADRLRGQLDDASNMFQQQVRPFLDGDAFAEVPEDAWLRVLAGKVLRAKGAYASLLIALCEAHGRDGEPLGPQVAELMRAYLREARSLAIEAHHCRRKAIDHRKHVYRNAAAVLAREAGLIGMVNTDFRQIARTMTQDGQDNELAQTARKYRTWAAPSELRLAIKQTGAREKVEMVYVPAANNTRTCSACGHVHEEKIEDLTFVCQRCSKVWDQDINSSANCRKFALEGREVLENQ